MDFTLLSPSVKGQTRSISHSPAGLGTTTEFAAAFKPVFASGPRSFDFCPDTGEVSLPPEFLSRRDRYENQRLAAAFTSRLHSAGLKVTDRLTYCGMEPAGENVPLVTDTSRNHRSMFSGLHVCANSWLCPVCSSIIQHKRAQEIRLATENAKDFGLSAWLVTLTVPHQSGERLSHLLSSMKSALRSARSRRDWKKEKSRSGWLGDIVSVEMTHGENGWHPHFHLIVFSESEPSKAVLHDPWSRSCVLSGLSSPSFERGVDVRGGHDAGTYINKMGDDSKTGGGHTVFWDAADELARGHTKKGRNQSKTPFDILRLYRAGKFSLSSRDESARFLRSLWAEYATATHGKSILQWSRGLKAKLSVFQLSDDDVLQTTEAVAQLQAIFTAREFRLIARTGSRVQVLESFELLPFEDFTRLIYDRFVKNSLPSSVFNTFSVFFDQFSTRLDDAKEGVHYSKIADAKAWQLAYPVNIDSTIHPENLSLKPFLPPLLT